ncbi:CSC1-like protein At3g54510 isoform X4 [Amaranthus tricolor]|uniref:CSC1-like protein At3g54510 isoform X4 n=1 Tax=Amaranthus tricolor TaxID=29722 RepID=UPI00258C9F1A|nr:CSC1-like protein At3g54510 isoform X4 [Amaranthus tricolor]
MTPQGLAASAAINIGLAMAVLCIFSILKKQPSNAFIYYARRLSQQHDILHNFDRFSFRRLLPSLSWIARALRVPEDDILRNFGLDALIIIRLFKFGIRFFVVCSFIGLLILLPINYFSESSHPSHLHYMNSFTISNINAGSNRLWVHFSCLWFISLYGLYMLYKEQAMLIQKKLQQMKEKSMKKKSNKKDSLFESLRGEASKIALLEEKLHKICGVICGLQNETLLQQMELPAAFVTFKTRIGAALAAQSQHHPHPFLWITEQAPEPRDLLWKNLSTPSRRMLLYKIGFYLAATLLTIFFAVPVAAVQGIAKFEKLKNWFPPAMALQLIPGLGSVVTGLLPGLILNGFIYIVPYSILGMAQLAGYSSTSQTEIKVCNMVFYFLVGNVFFLSLLSGSLLDELGESFSHPGNFPNRLAHAVAAQADFFTTYILSDGLSGFSLEILQAGLLTWDAIKRHTFCRGKKNSPYLYSLPYFRVIPFVCLCLLIGMVYALVAPLLLPFLVGYLYTGYAVYMNQMEDVYPTVYETCGQYWPYIHSYIFVALVLTQITMIGLFGLKSKPGAVVATLPLLVFTLLFNEYCKLRFLPSFCQNTIQDVKEDDETDEKEGTLEINSRNAADAYYPPFLKPISFPEEGSSSRNHQQPV